MNCDCCCWWFQIKSPYGSSGSPTRMKIRPPAIFSMKNASFMLMMLSLLSFKWPPTSFIYINLFSNYKKQIAHAPVCDLNDWSFESKNRVCVFRLTAEHVSTHLSLATGLSSDPPHLWYPGPGRDGSSNHIASSKPPPASVGSEELRVCVQHPGKNPTHPCCPLQLLLHPMSEHFGEIHCTTHYPPYTAPQSTQGNEVEAVCVCVCV